MIKLNVDSAGAINHQKTSMGFIARDSLGLVLGAVAKRIVICSPLFGELWAIRHGLERTKCNKYRSVILETDSKIACRIVNDLDSWRGNQQALVGALVLFFTPIGTLVYITSSVKSIILLIGLRIKVWVFSSNTFHFTHCIS